MIVRPTATFLAACLWMGLCLGSAFPSERILTSYYGAESGTRTASGAPFRPSGLTAAHRTWAFGTVLRVCYRGCVVVTVTDRGPSKRLRPARGLDLSEGAARRVGLIGPGVAWVEVERL